MFEYLANGGDGYSMFTDYEVTREALVTDTHAVSNFIEYDLDGVIPQKYSESQGRIISTNETDESIGRFITYNKKNKGLSAGAIIAIIIPCVAVLVIITALVLMSRKDFFVSNNIPSRESHDNIAPKLSKV